MSKETPNSSTSINFPPINNTNSPHTTKPQSEGHAHHDSQLSQVSHSAHTTLMGLILARINFREFREFWPNSRN